VLVGSGPERASLAAKARELGAGNVYFLDPVPKTAIPAWLGAMDALFLGFRDSALYRFGVSPNKLFDYMMAGKPIVCALSAGNDLVAEAGCGLTVPADAPAALAQAILALHQAGPQRRQAMGSAGKAFVLARHTYPHLSARFLEALQPVGAGQPEP